MLPCLALQLAFQISLVGDVMDIFQNGLVLAWELIDLVYDAFVDLFTGLLNLFGVIPDLISMTYTYLELLPDEVKWITILSFGTAFTFAICGLIIKIVLTVADLLL